MPNESSPAQRSLRTIISVILVGIVLMGSSWFFAAMCLMAAATVWAGFRGGWREWLTWVAMLVVFSLFANLRARMGPAVEPRTLFMYVIHLETLGGLLELPTNWLQARLQASLANSWGVLDALLTAIYLSFFVIPQVVVVYLWRKGGPFGRYVSAACLLFGGALLIHFFLPTAPPWLAAQEGFVPAMDRIGVRVLTGISETLTEGGYQASANDVAAMPSVHQGLTVLAMFALTSHRREMKWVAWVYSLAMLLSITYLGEHYAVDGIAGALMAWGSWRLTGGFGGLRGRDIGWIRPAPGG